MTRTESNEAREVVNVDFLGNVSLDVREHFACLPGRKPSTCDEGVPELGSVGMLRGPGLAVAPNMATACAICARAASLSPARARHAASTSCAATAARSCAVRSSLLSS